MIAAQHTLGWYRARLGNITGSMVGVLMKKPRSGDFTDTAESYLYQIAAERTMSSELVNDDERFQEYLDSVNVTTKAMKWGNDKESEARQLYELISGEHVVELGSCKHKEEKTFASSPDGFIVKDDGTKVCLEIKCPNQNTYIKYAATIVDNDTLKAVKPEYYWQCMAHMSCTDASSTIFIVYCPWQSNSLHCVDIKRDEEAISSMLERVRLAESFIERITSLFVFDGA